MAEETLLRQTVDWLSKLNLPELDEEWVHNVWDSQFTECEQLPAHYFQVTVGGNRGETLQILSRVTDLAQQWIETFGREQSRETSAHNTSLNESRANAGGHGFWSYLIEQDVKYKALIGLLFYFLDRGQKLNANAEDREFCLKATSLYFILLGVPGSGAFKIFHPVLYNKALDTFKLALKLHLVRLSPKKKPANSRKPKGSQKQQQGPRRRHMSRTSSTCSGLSQFESDDDDDEFDDGVLSQHEVQELTISLNKVVYHFLTFLDNCSLKRSAESLELTISELVDLTHLETGFANMDFGRTQRRSGLSAMAFNAYVGLEKVCQPMHGNVKKNVLLVMKNLLPAILMAPRGASELAPRGLTIIREHTMHFVKHLMTRVGDENQDVVEILIQNIAVKVQDKAEFRQKASMAIVDLTRGLPREVFNRTVRWLFTLAHSDKAASRQFTVEVLGKLLHEDEREVPEVEIEGIAPLDPAPKSPTKPQPEERMETEGNEENAADSSNQEVVTGEGEVQNSSDLVSHKWIFGVIFSRCRDVSATVRAKALQILSDVTASNNPNVVQILEDLFNENNDGRGKSKSGFVDFIELLQDPDVDLTQIDPLPSSKVFIEFLRKRALDESVYVRKNGLQVLENVLKISGRLLSEDLIQILAEHCRDPSVMVRKQLVGSLTALVRTYPDRDNVIKSWVEGVFPLILDVEQKAAEKVLECIWDCLFGNLVRYSSAQQNRHFLPWKILDHTESLKMTKYLSRACGIWAKSGLLKPTIMGTLKTHVNTENNESTWLLLSLISAHVPLPDPHFVMEYFNTSIHTPEGVGLYTLLQVLRVLFASVSRLDRNEQTLLQRDLILLVKRFAIPPELISTAVDIATVVSSIEAGENNLKRYHANIEGWAVEIIEVIDEELSRKILQPEVSDVEDTRMTRQIFTLGELAQICPNRVNKRLFLLMQSIIFQQGKKVRKSKTKDDDSAPPIEMPSSQTQSSQPPQCAFTPTTKLQALSVVTIAKMCLPNEDMAKKIVPAFGRLLDSSSDSAVRNNIIYALSDMCVRYASLVDPLLPQITACLKDKSLTVRRTTLTTLIHLLQEDYLKMSGRGAFFFRILQTLSDESDEIKHLTMFYIQQRLLKRNPKIMYQHFIEAIFHFNEYEGHKSYNKFVISERERLLFSLSSSDNKEERMKLYKFMLENMNDEHRFQTTYKLCQDILGGAVEGTVSLDPKSFSLLKDTLACLACDEIKLASLKSRQDDDDIGNTVPAEEDFAGAVVAAAKKTIISQVVKKNVIENIIPIVIALKHKLENVHSPLLDDLMNYLRELLKDYKNEVNEILSADKQLATEIQYDLKKWEEEQERLLESQRDTESRPATPECSDNELVRAALQTAMSKALQRKAKPTEGDGPNPAENLLQKFLSKHLNAEESTGDRLLLNSSPTVRIETPKKHIDEMARSMSDADRIGRNENAKDTEVENVPSVEMETNENEKEEIAQKSGTENQETNQEDEVNLETEVLVPGGGGLDAGDAAQVNEKKQKENTQNRDDSPTPADSAGMVVEDRGEKEKQKQKEDEGHAENVEELNAGPEKEREEEAKESDEKGKEGRDGKEREDDEKEGGEEEKEVESADERDVPPDLAADKEISEKKNSTPEAKQTRGNTSRRLTGRGIERNTPVTKKARKNLLRAISTPNQNETALASDVTFLEKSTDISVIPVLSPPSASKKKKKKNEDIPKETNTSDCSFRFRRGKKDLFDGLVQDDKNTVKAVKSKTTTEPARRSPRKHKLADKEDSPPRKSRRKK